VTTTTLLCTDGSELALQALQAGLTLLRPSERTVVVTVVDGVDPMDVTGAGIAGGVMSPEEFDQQRRQEQRDAEQVVDETSNALGIAGADTRVLAGSPGPALCALARELDASVLVMGSRGRGGIKRALLGSVSDHVVRNAPCTVMITGAAQTA
jgi:nucleotide-binding universal stress UspA family protein